MTSEVVQSHLDLIWIMVAAAMVMFMQAGFTALESGLTRAKNTINVAMKNITDFVLAILLFWAVGYGLMFGSDVMGLWGDSMFGLEGADQPMDYASFVFQATFAGTAATIVSGAVAERMRFLSYAVISIVLSALIYPISGHWIWGSGGWLSDMGMVDFAGSTVVHSVGAWVGLAGAILLGPRIGRFCPEGKPTRMSGHSLVLAVIGVMILWFGWFGFNGGSLLKADMEVAKIIANTMLAAAAGGVISLLLASTGRSGHIPIEKVLNGTLAGLVGITAGCAVVNTGGAIIIGLTSGLIVYFAEDFILKVLRIDDPVSAIAVHGVGGAWGTLMLAVVAPAENLPLKDNLDQLGVQAIGVISVFFWSFLTGLLLFGVMRFTKRLRVDADAEHMGLNIHEHGATSGLLETMEAMRNIIEAHRSGKGEGDLTRRIEVEIGTEAGDIAHLFNLLMDTFHDTVKEIKGSVNSISNAASELDSSSSALNSDAAHQYQNVQSISEAMQRIAGAVEAISGSALLAVQHTEEAVEKAEAGSQLANQSTQSIHKLAEDVHHAGDVIDALVEDTNSISEILDTIQTIAEQTNLLALNAAIEAARAGESGRGFAVVADEVRNLSTKTQSATTRIEQVVTNLRDRSANAKRVMQGSVAAARQCVDVSRETDEHLQAIRDVVEQIHDLSQDVSQSTQTQSESMTQVAQSVALIEAQTQQSASRAGTSLSLSQLLAEMAGKLERLTANLIVREMPQSA
ncbi:ammonium transporter [Pokkaliibacter sp. CJK22405]|uniref:ammonium transporter n=1 Tax=Pokkaliibacter sp. CJK22405 TaxID=3384615 RepID=UPI0039848AE5